MNIRTFIKTNIQKCNKCIIVKGNNGIGKDWLINDIFKKKIMNKSYELVEINDIKELESHIHSSIIHSKNILNCINRSSHNKTVKNDIIKILFIRDLDYHIAISKNILQIIESYLKKVNSGKNDNNTRIIITCNNETIENTNNKFKNILKYASIMEFKGYNKNEIITILNLYLKNIRTKGGIYRIPWKISNDAKIINKISDYCKNNIERGKVLIDNICIIVNFKKKQQRQSSTSNTNKLRQLDIGEIIDDCINQLSDNIKENEAIIDNILNINENNINSSISNIVTFNDNLINISKNTIRNCNFKLRFSNNNNNNNNLKILKIVDKINNDLSLSSIFSEYMKEYSNYDEIREYCIVFAVISPLSKLKKFNNSKLSYLKNLYFEATMFKKIQSSYKLLRSICNNKFDINIIRYVLKLIFEGNIPLDKLNNIIEYYGLKGYNIKYMKQLSQLSYNCTGLQMIDSRIIKTLGNNNITHSHKYNQKQINNDTVKSKIQTKYNSQTTRKIKKNIHNNKQIKTSINTKKPKKINIKKRKIVNKLISNNQQTLSKWIK